MLSLLLYPPLEVNALENIRYTPIELQSDELQSLSISHEAPLHHNSNATSHQNCMGLRST